MKITAISCLCFSLLIALVAGWTKEGLLSSKNDCNFLNIYFGIDHEIFRLRDELQTTEDPEATFYGRPTPICRDVLNELTRTTL